MKCISAMRFEAQRNWVIISTTSLVPVGGSISYCLPSYCSSSPETVNTGRMWRKSSFNVSGPPCNLIQTTNMRPIAGNDHPCTLQCMRVRVKTLKCFYKTSKSCFEIPSKTSRDCTAPLAQTGTMNMYMFLPSSTGLSYVCTFCMCWH